MPTQQELNCRLAFSLEEKEEFTRDVIQQWYEYWEGKVRVSFSGGKDSTVLLHQVRKLYPDVPATFVDTGLEYPEIITFVKTIDNVKWLRPKIPFHKVIEKYGYPVAYKEVAGKINAYHSAARNNNPTTMNNILYGRESDGGFKLPEKWKYLLNAPFKISDVCCNIMKKDPLKKVKGLFPFIGTMASDSSKRSMYYLRDGCNLFDSKFPSSKPLSIWTEKDIWEYIHKYKIPYSKIYDMGYDRTGCMFCMFGLHMQKGENKFQRMAITHPKQYHYCMEKLGLREILEYMKLSYKPVQGLFSQEYLREHCKIKDEK